MFEIKICDGDILKLSGRLDAAQAEEADSVLSTITESVTLDLSELDYISSAGVGVLLKAFKTLSALGKSIQFVSMKPRVRNIFAYAGLDRIFDIKDP